MTKRSFDLVFSILGFALLFPFSLIIGFLIIVESQGPALFKQDRIGIKGKIFKIYKFRTMYLDSERGSSLTIGFDSRITKTGRFLRKYKLDEFPQLLNVIRGDMSLVGPRPELKLYIDKYPAESRNKILSVKPGITDEASIIMSNESDILKDFQDPEQAYIDLIIPKKIIHYLDYVENRSFFGDFKIILKTLKKVFI
jgi:lipopolysaccharide/colanic/teichoic acid biosynthesis glycosyltransferase